MENDFVDRLIDKHGDVVSAMFYVHKKIDEILNGFKLKNEYPMNDENMSFWIEVYDELNERQNLEI
jgi:hypothetical protein